MMMTPDTLLLLYIPCANAAEARDLAARLLAARLIACANLHPIRSLYRWEGAVVEEDEVVLLAKTTAGRADAAEALVAAHHSYQVPAIVRVPVAGVNAPYAAWVCAEVADPAPHRGDP